MARKKSDPVPLRVEETIGGEIVPEGDFAGMRVDDVLRALTDQVHDVVGDVSIEVAGATLDMALGEYLAVVQDVSGDKTAKLFAVRFCETAIPYATLPVSISETYGSVRKIAGNQKRS